MDRLSIYPSVCTDGRIFAFGAEIESGTQVSPAQKCFIKYRPQLNGCNLSFNLNSGQAKAQPPEEVGLEVKLSKTPSFILKFVHPLEE